MREARSVTVSILTKEGSRDVRLLLDFDGVGHAIFTLETAETLADGIKDAVREAEAMVPAIPMPGCTPTPKT